MNTTDYEWEVEIDGKRIPIEATGIKRRSFFHSSKFDPNIHPEIAFEELSKMHSMTAVCARIVISKDTFYNWYANYADFKAAVDLGRMVGETRFEGIAIDNFENRSFNAVLWQMYGRRVYGYTETRLVNIDGMKEGMTYEEELGKILMAVSNGSLTPKEGLEAATIVATKAKTYEQMEAKKLLEDMSKLLDKK